MRSVAKALFMAPGKETYSESGRCEMLLAARIAVVVGEEVETANGRLSFESAVRRRMRTLIFRGILRKRRRELLGIGEVEMYHSTKRSLKHNIARGVRKMNARVSLRRGGCRGRRHKSRRNPKALGSRRWVYAEMRDRRRRWNQPKDKKSGAGSLFEHFILIGFEMITFFPGKRGVRERALVPMAGAGAPSVECPSNPRPHLSGESATTTCSRKVRWPRRDCPSHRNKQQDKCVW